MIVFTRCDDNPIEPRVDSPLIPLSVGNSWTYVVGTSISLLDTVSEQITANLSVILGRDTFSAFVRKTPIFRNAYPDHGWIEWLGNDGLYGLGGLSNSDTLISRYLMFQYPVNIGDSWEVPVLRYSKADERFYFRDTLVVSCVAIDAVFPTWVGSFNCVVYKFSQKPADDILAVWDYYFYYSPGIGNVGHRAISQLSGTIKEQSVLLSCNVRN